ncbi:MAG: hypothetical protein QOE86_1123 [Solirubrobacteraceae bacterium]|nr:hypothetical protein [Solirubrobacteraceae bacterium]
MRVRSFAVACGVAVASLAGAVSASAAADTLVSSGSPATPFSANKQNEPAVAVDPLNPSVLVSGANDNIDMEACNAGPDDTCPFTADVGVSGLYISQDTGASWTQPTYTGLSARTCTGAVGDGDPPCTASTGPIGTLPNYAEHGLVSDGDPAVAFGPAFSGGKPSYDNGSRLYYANLTSKTTGSTAFKGFEAIAVSHTDDVPAAASGDESAWSAPVIASKQNSALFSDKEQIWADNAESSSHFGNVYVCYAGFRSASHGGQPLFVLRSTNGGESFTSQQVSAAANNTSSNNGFGRSGCTVRTDSAGKVYVFVYQIAAAAGAAEGKIQLITSTNGGDTYSKPRTIFGAFDTCGYIEASIGRCVLDGVAGARSDLSPVPSVDIANNAPSGTGASNQIVMSWVDGKGSPAAARVMYSTSTDRGASFSAPIDITQGGDRGYYAAPAISPNGKDVYVVYNAFTTPFRDSAVGAGNDRQLVGVVLHADATATDAAGFTEIHRGASGDARGSSQNDLAAEFLGDYVYAAATNTYGAAVWNDVRNAADCPAVDTYRQALHDEAVSTGAQTAEAEEPRGEAAKGGDAGAEPSAESLRPNPQQDCADQRFGNSDIYGGVFSDPTP